MMNDTSKQTVTVQDRPLGYNLHKIDIISIATFVTSLATILTGPIITQILGQFGISDSVAQKIEIDFAAIVGVAGLIVRVYGNKTGTNTVVQLTPPDTATKVNQDGSVKV